MFRPVGKSTVGAGVMVIVKVIGVPVHGPFVGVTLIVATSVPLRIALAKLIFPIPEAPRPIAGLSFVQLNVVPAGIPVNGILTIAPPHSTTSATGSMVG